MLSVKVVVGGGGTSWAVKLSEHDGVAIAKLQCSCLVTCQA